MTSSLEEKKDLASRWFRSLRDQFCTAFEELDGGKFERKNWNHKGSGGGEISILKGKVFEKVGVNISTVAGEFSDDFKSQIKGTENLQSIGLLESVWLLTCNLPRCPLFISIRDFYLPVKIGLEVEQI